MFGTDAPAFRLFGAAHLVALGAIFAATTALIACARASRNAALVARGGLIAALVGGVCLATLALRRAGVSWLNLAPLHLCDAAIFVAIWALVTLRPLASEVVFLWGATGTLLAVITPDLQTGFPSVEFFSYFALHGAVIASAFLLPLGLRRRPRPNAHLRVLAVTNLYALFVGAVDVLTGADFLYLRAKPASHTPLDWLGPWPLYILVADVLALLLFRAWTLPFRR